MLAAREAEWEKLSDDTKAAHAEYERLRERDLEALQPKLPSPAKRNADDGEQATPPLREVKKAEPWDGIRRLKDDGWE